MSTLTICLIVTIVILLLMIITGGIFYDYKGKAFGLFGPVQVPSPQPFFNPPPGINFRPPEYVSIYDPKVSELSPVVPVYNKLTSAQGCLRAPPQKGYIAVYRPPKCVTAGPCPSGHYHKFSLTPTYQPIKTFNINYKKSWTVLEWLDMYPSYLANRLFILTHLLDQTIEKWALGGFLHKCPSHSNFDTTKWTLCNERYNCIKCVISNIILTESFYPPAISNNKNKPYYPSDEKSQNSMNYMKYERRKTVYQLNGLRRPNQLAYIFQHTEKTIQPFQTKNQKGKEFHICGDYSQHMYSKYFLAEVWKVMPASITRKESVNISTFLFLFAVIMTTE